MNQSEVGRRTVILTGVLGASFAVASAILFGFALGFDPGAGSDLVDRLVATNPSDAEFVRWGAVADMLGYYLLPALVMVSVGRRLTWSDTVPGRVATLGGLMYATVGAIGAAVLATTAPPLIEDGSPQALLMLETVGNLVEGLWQWLEPVPFTVWGLGVALALKRSGSVFAWLFACLALGGVLVWIGRLAGAEAVLIAGLSLWLTPFPVALAAVGRWGYERH